MNDLAEHIGTILWIAGALLFLCGIFAGLIWKDQRKSIASVAREAGKFSEWLKHIAEQEGGVVTRSKYFEWCKEQQGKCPACGGYRGLVEWKNNMLDKGGVMGRNEVADLLGEKLCQEFEHHRSLIAAELKLVRSEIALVKSEVSKDVLQGMTEMKDELLEQMAEVERRAK